MRKAVSDLLANKEFQKKVRSIATCDELANDLLEASGQMGGLLTINPSKQGGRIRFPEGVPSKVGMSNYHQVYTDGTSVIDPRYNGGSPIPRAEYEATIKRLNGLDASIDFQPARREK